MTDNKGTIITTLVGIIIGTFVTLFIHFDNKKVTDIPSTDIEKSEQINIVKNRSKPYISTSFYNSQEGTGWHLSVLGKGSAKVYWAEVLYKNKPVLYWEDLADEQFDVRMDKANEPLFTYLNPQLGLAEAGMANWLIKTKNIDLANHFINIRKFVKFRICYCSEFDECFVTSKIPWENDVENCQSINHINFKGVRNPGKLPDNYYN